MNNKNKINELDEELITRICWRSRFTPGLSMGHNLECVSLAELNKEFYTTPYQELYYRVRRLARLRHIKILRVRRSIICCPRETKE